MHSNGRYVVLPLCVGLYLRKWPRSSATSFGFFAARPMIAADTGIGHFIRRLC